MVAWGYRVGEVPIKPVVSMNPNARIKLKPSTPRQRMIAQVSLGVHDPRACLPAPDRNHALSTLAGMVVRLAPEPTVRAGTFAEFLRQEFMPWIKYWFKPVERTKVMSLDDWLEHRPYSQSRKDELRKAFYEYVPDMARRLCTAEAFIKAEAYLAYKMPRWICPLPDYVKAVMGPVAHAVEQQVINMPRFIKKIAAHERIDFLCGALFSGVTMLISEGDYSKMESQHGELVNQLMCNAFEYFTADLPEGTEYMRFFRGLALHVDETGEFRWEDDPVLNSKTFELYGVHVLQSGKMETSIQNGILNMALYDLGNKFFFNRDYREEGVGIFEGDDRISPEELARHLTTVHFKFMGHVCDTRQNPAYPTESHNASGDFCGMVVEPVERILVTDVVAAYVAFGWASDAYAMVRPSRHLELLRARAYSMVYQYNSCPILHELGCWVLRKTAHVKLDAFFARRNKICQYDMQQLIEAYEHLKNKTTFPNRCGMRTRLLIEGQYGPTVAEQLAAEEWLKADPPLQPLRLIDERHFPSDWINYQLDYVREEKLEDIQKGTCLPPYMATQYTVFTDEFFENHGHQITGFGEKGRAAIAALPL